MEEKQCSSCKNTLPSAFFNRKGKYLQPFCKECAKAHSKKYYKENKQSHLLYCSNDKKRKKNQFEAWKRTLKCTKCTENYFRCLDFHHLDPTQKDMNISASYVTVGTDTLIAELTKCVVLCKNCHVKVHDGEISSDDLIPLTKEQINIGV